MTTIANKQSAYIAEYPSDDAYHNDRSRLSGSNLDLFDKNPSLFASWRAGLWNQKTTPELAFGSLFHALVLEPDTVDERFAIEPEDPEKPGKCIHRGSKVYKAWRAAATKAGKTVVAMDDVVKIRPMATKLGQMPDVMDLFTCEGGMNEVALHFEIAGRPMRAKLDRIIPDRDIIVELKTCRSAKPSEKNAWQWEGHGYARKTWIYLNAYHQVFKRHATMIHIFAEKDTSHPQVGWFWTQIDDPAAQWGEIEALRVLGEIQRCEEAEDFRASFEPGAPGAETRSLPLPGALLSRLEFINNGPAELSIGGKTVTL